MIQYNRQKTGFVIVDGQHRAMAVLALHRQINSNWGSDRFASFYTHLSVNAEELQSIELPVCILFFPELHEANDEWKSKGLDLKKVCREIFLVVNKTAKKVSQSRELLLDDEDFAARMMRKTLSKLKDRSEEDGSVARIYSFAFGDSDADTGRQVVAGQLEYTSAVALHKMHAAISFGMPDSFNFDSPPDITDGRRVRNSARPTDILLGTSLEKWASLSRSSGNYHPPSEVEQAVQLLAEITDIPLLLLFDKFRPFVSHNTEMRRLRTRLLDPDARAELIQNKCYSLLFEGSGVRNVFEEHRRRLDERQKEMSSEGRSVNDYISNQLTDASAVIAALDIHESSIRIRRAARLFSIDYDKFSATDNFNSEKYELATCAKTIFDTISTQAFQIGYLMAIHTVVERLIEPGFSYDHRVQVVRFISNLYVNALNVYFSSSSNTEHRTLTGFIEEPRVRVFDSSRLGLRALLSQTNVRELNERQWTFFRYALLEMVHSKHAFESILRDLNNAPDQSLAEKYKVYLPTLIGTVLSLREKYINSAIDATQNSAGFKMQLELLKMQSRVEGKSDVEIEDAVNQKIEQMKRKVREECEQNIRASLGEFSTQQTILKRLGVTASDNT